MRRTVAVLAGALLVGAGAAGTVAAVPAAAAAGSAPRVSTVSPSSASTAGGSRVTLTGSHFARGMTVSFGKARGSSVHVLSSTKLQVTSPAHAAGAVDVTVHTKAGTSTRRSADRFTFVSPPSISSVSAATGDATGGARLTVTGHGFTGVSAVSFGSAAGTSMKVLSSTKLQVTTPPHPSGTYDIHVVNRYGSSRSTSVDRFVFTTSIAVPTSVGVDGAFVVSAYGLRPGSSVQVALDDGTYPLGTAKAAAGTGVVSLGVALAGQVPDGPHVLRITGTDGSGAPATFDSPLLVDVVAPTLDGATAPIDAVHVGDDITLSVHASDEGGLQYVIIEVHATGGGASPCKGQVATLEQGTATDGTWSLTCTLLPNTLPGEYEVTPWGADLANNLVNMGDDGSVPMATFTVAP